jgi:hypothetical protein
MSFKSFALLAPVLFLALLGNQWVVLRLNKLDFAKSLACGRAAYETVKLV